METLGSLIDKLTVIELKIVHSQNIPATTLMEQKTKLCKEIDTFVAGAIAGKIDAGDLTFESNKVYDGTIRLPDFTGEIGELVASLGAINCDIWHKVDQSYHADALKRRELVKLVNDLAVMNLHRNKCIDNINSVFREMVA
jgi:hypothetical protein